MLWSVWDGTGRYRPGEHETGFFGHPQFPSLSTPTCLRPTGPPPSETRTTKRRPVGPRQTPSEGRLSPVRTPPLLCPGSRSGPVADTLHTPVPASPSVCGSGTLFFCAVGPSAPPLHRCLVEGSRLDSSLSCPSRPRSCTQVDPKSGDPLIPTPPRTPGNSLSLA